METKKPIDIAELLDIVGVPKALSNIIGTALRFAEWAEESLEEGAENSRPSFTFLALQPSGPLQTLNSEIVYKAHCKELIGRMERGEDITEGTKAEVVAVLSLNTLRSRLVQDYEHLYVRLFGELFPNISERLPQDEGSLSHETYPGAADEIYRVIRKKLQTQRYEEV